MAEFRDFLAQDCLAADRSRAYVGRARIERSTGRIDVIVIKSLTNTPSSFDKTTNVPGEYR
jgi:hypothetical protein